MSAQTLRRAAEIVRERGLAKGQYELRTGELCLFGVLCHVHYGRTGSHLSCNPDVTADARAVGAVMDLPTWSLTHWNDAPERTAEDVAAAFEAAAARLEAAS